MGTIADQRRRHRRSRPLAARPPQRRPGDGAPGRPARRPCSARSIERSGIDPLAVGQVIGGCVSQVGEQTFNIARTAWLERRPAARGRGAPPSTASAARRSRPRTSRPRWSQSGVVDVALACGVESMSRVPLGAAMRGDFGRPTPPSYCEHYELTVAVRRRGTHRRQVGHHPRRLPTSSGSSRSCARSGRGPRAGSSARSCRSTRPTSTKTASRPGTTHHVARDEGLRETSLEALAKLKPVARENGVHTAGIVVADHRRRGRGAADDGGPAPRARPDGRGRASSTSASSASTPCSCSPARSTRPAGCIERTGLTHRRLRRDRDQRGVRVGRARVGARAEARHGAA